MTKAPSIAGFLFAALLSGCASLEVTRDIKHGRVALLSGNTDLAISHFERAAALNGTASSPPLHEGAWTYVGRAYYHAMKYPQARQALERALARDEQDKMARLYAAMTSARENMDSVRRREIQAALQSLHDQVEHIAYRTPQGRFWDPSGALRAEFRASLEAISAEAPDWDMTLTRIADLGLAVEKEVDQARRDEARAYRRSARD
jgi:tetratricopeptide (TPR) repeat protein